VCVHCIYLKVIHSIEQWQILIQMSGLVEVHTMQHCNIMLDLEKDLSLEQRYISLCSDAEHVAFHFYFALL